MADLYGTKHVDYDARKDLERLRKILSEMKKKKEVAKSVDSNKLAESL